MSLHCSRQMKTQMINILIQVSQKMYKIKLLQVNITILFILFNYEIILFIIE